MFVAILSRDIFPGSDGRLMTNFSLGLVTLNRKPLRENYRIKGNVEYVVDKSVIKCVTELPGCNDRLNHNQRYTDGRDCLLRRI